MEILFTVKRSQQFSLKRLSSEETVTLKSLIVEIDVRIEFL